ncbi:MAG: hypothetical protein PVI82_07365 [Desulfobacterales bacterium]|jgi:hypothetical protein
MKKLLIIVAIILLPSIALASFSIQFDNTTDKKMVYLLYWIDHTYDWPLPFNLAGGELDAQEKIDLKVSYKNGRYFVIWSDKGEWQNKLMLNVNAGVTSVKVTPEKGNMQK